MAPKKVTPTAVATKAPAKAKKADPPAATPPAATPPAPKPPKQAKAELTPDTAVATKAWMYVVPDTRFSEILQRTNAHPEGIAIEQGICKYSEVPPDGALQYDSRLLVIELGFDPRVTDLEQEITWLQASLDTATQQINDLKAELATRPTVSESHGEGAAADGPPADGSGTATDPA